jgi:hypothetical protein
MRPVFVIAAIAIALLVFAEPTLAESSAAACRIEMIVGRIEKVEGDAQGARLLHGDNPPMPVAVGACIIYGDKIETDPETTVTIAMAKGERHAGGIYDPTFEAPKAREEVSQGFSSLMTTMFGGFMSRQEAQTAYATGRGSEKCSASSASAAVLAPLDRLQQKEQRIGADLRAIEAAWKPSPDTHRVQARLRGADGAVLAEAGACRESHVLLSIPAGKLRAADRLTLDIADDRGGGLLYSLAIVDPNDLPRPPVAADSQWLLGAWRLGAASPDARLDAIARLLAAPAESLAAKRILDAVWSDSSF